MKIEVRETSGKWGVFLGEHLLGESKARSDADLHKNVLDNLLKAEYNRGVDDGYSAGEYDARTWDYGDNL